MWRLRWSQLYRRRSRRGRPSELAARFKRLSRGPL